MKKKKFYLPSFRSSVDSFLVLDVLQESKLMEQRGREIFHLELGEPISNTPKKVQDEVKRLVNTKISGYTPSNGIYELRKKISDYYLAKNKIIIEPEQIFITSGSSGAFLLTFLACFDPGDKVAIFNPVYPAYRNILKSLNIDVIEIPPNKKDLNHIDIKKIKKYKSIDGVIVSNPNNPTGQVLTKEELNFLYSFCKDEEIVLISDEIYHGIQYEKKTFPILTFGQKAIIINSFSKFFCMPGWRLGWVVVPETLCHSYLKLSQNLFISSGNIAQFSATKVFDCINELASNVDIYCKSRDFVIDKFSKISVLKFCKPYGAFYFYFDVEATKVDSSTLVKEILNDTGVALTSGIDFDKKNGKRFIRLSFSNNPEVVKKGVSKLQNWFVKNY